MSVPTIAPYFPFRRIKIINQVVTAKADAAHTLVALEIEKVVLYFFFGHLIRRLFVEPSDPSNSGKIGPLCVTRKVVKFHNPDHFLT